MIRAILFSKQSVVGSISYLRHKYQKRMVDFFEFVEPYSHLVKQFDEPLHFTNSRVVEFVLFSVRPMMRD